MTYDELEQSVLHHIAKALVECEYPDMYACPDWKPRDVEWLLTRCKPFAEYVAQLRELVSKLSWTSITLVPANKAKFAVTVSGEAWYGELRGPNGKRQIIIRPYAFPVIIVDPDVYPALR